jgi:hypothetical protein
MRAATVACRPRKPPRVNPGCVECRVRSASDEKSSPAATLRHLALGASARQRIAQDNRGGQRPRRGRSRKLGLLEEGELPRPQRVEKSDPASRGRWCRHSVRGEDGRSGAKRRGGDGRQCRHLSRGLVSWTPSRRLPMRE